MTTKKSYSRHFIILQEEEKGYALASDKLPSGYAKIEIKSDKCRITYYVQNLKKEMCPYHMILICNKKDVKKIINLGELNIDDYGRTEVAYEYNSDDLDGSGVSIEKVVGAAIAKISEGNIRPVMVGFITSENQEGWRLYPMITKIEKEEIIQNEEISPPEAADLPEENRKYVIEEPVEPKEGTIDIPPDSSDDTEVEVENIFDNYETQIENMKNESENKEEIREEIKEETREEEYPIGDLGDYFKRVAVGFEEMRNIFTDIKRCRWYKIPVIQESDYHTVPDYDKYSVIYYPMYGYFNYIKKYQHFLIGYKCDSLGQMKYIVYAIPGNKTIVDQPFKGNTGFVSWWPLNREEGSQGYWLMFYDFKDRTVVVPIRS